MMSKTENSMNDHEIVYCNFIKQRIQSAGGSIKFQHLTGHLSQLSLDVRKSVGGGTQELMKFLRKHQNIFTIDPKGNVSVKQAASHFFAPVKDFEEETSQSKLPLNITDGYGVVTGLHPTFGFINAKHPLKTSVYFSPANFENGKGTLLTDYDLFMGCRLYFNAVLGNPNFDTKYKATKVWKPAEPETPPDEPITRKLRKDRDTGLYDPNVKEGEGVVHNVFPTHAFITIEDDPSSSVFFHKNHLSKFSNVIDLTEIIKVGTVVEFSAMRSTKPDAKARWEATKVWIKGNKSKKKSKKTEEKQLSDDDSVYDDYSASSSNSLPSKKENHIEIFNSLIQNKTKQKSDKLLENESGKFYARASGSVVKFGPKLSELADADSALFYIHGAKVMDKVWEFNDGDSVKFDAVRIKSAPGWKVVLGWVGDKPDVVVSTEDFGISDDETSEASDEQAPSIPPHREQKKEWRNSNYKKRNSSPPAKLFPKSSKSSLDLESEKDSGIYSYSENKKTKESFLSLTDLEKERYQNLQSSRSSSLSRSSGSSKGSQKKYNKSRQSQDSKLPNMYANETENESAKFTSVRKSKYNWADVTSSGDEEDSELSIIKTEDKERKSVEIDDEINENEPYYSNLQTTNIADKFGDLLAISDDDVDCENDNDEVENDENKANESIKLSNVDVSEASAKNLKPYVKFFEGILGTVSTAYSRFIRIESKALQDTAVCGFNDIYRNGTPISDHFDDVREVVKNGDPVKFNCFEILDDFGHYWQVVTMAWKGNKPKIEQISVKDFLKSRPDITVTINDEPQREPVCEASSKSMRLLNKEKEAVGSQKYLAVVNSNIGDDDTNIESEASNFHKQVLNDDEEIISSLENKKKFLVELHDNREEIVPYSSSCKLLASKISRMLIEEDIVNRDALQNLHNISLQIADLLIKETKDDDKIYSDKCSLSVDKNFQADVSHTSLNATSQTDDCNASSIPRSSSSNSSSNKCVQTIITGEIFSQSIFTQ